MKRSIDSSSAGDNLKMKKIKSEQETDLTEADKSELVLTDDNLLYEILKHADAKTLAAVSCVSKQWNKTSQDERLWEMICTKQSANIGCGIHQLRSVVLALGGFRRLHSLYLWPLSNKPSSSSSSSSSTPPFDSSWPCFPPTPPPAVVGPSRSTAAGSKTRWGKDEVLLSVSLLSIRYFEKINQNTIGK
ncbi:F-box protein GID2-like [Impatiens glandulifera]|uniref:F-box protein GID2-like n=1 Tax=Impatiens glandulifera TaxID=253017 RepID=UPI001FB1857D|nr:F-box protein GID2-like [Impatiens glandulifera]